jgi:hypothetical protein
LFILHPYNNDRPRDKRQCWKLLEEVRKEFTVIDIEVGRMSYPGIVAQYWGKEDMIVLEDDKSTTIEVIREIASCAHTHCLFPYPTRLWWKTTLDDWLGPNFPYGFGLVKFKKEVQQAVPPSDWDHSRPNDNIDLMIEMPIIERFGDIYVHPTMIKHHHSRMKWAFLDGLFGHDFWLQAIDRLGAPLTRAGIPPISLGYLEQCRKEYGGLNVKGKTVVDMGCDWGSSVVYWWMNGAEKIIGFESNPLYLKMLRALPKKRVPLDFRGPWDGEYPDGDVLKVDIEGAESKFDLPQLDRYDQWAFAVHRYKGVDTFWMIPKLKEMGGILAHRQQGEEVWVKA